MHIVNEAAANEASEMMAAVIQPEVDRFKEEVTQELAALQNYTDSIMTVAAPPVLEFYADTVIQRDSNLVALIRFRPSKNEPLGLIQFQVDILEPSEARILDIWPDIESHNFQYDEEDSKQIADNRVHASLSYTILGIGWPTFRLSLSEPAVVSIDGNYLLEPINLEIE